MKGYERIRDGLHDEQGRKHGLDRAQLVKLDSLVKTRFEEVPAI